MSVPGPNYCQKCRTCNTITSNQPGNLSAPSRFESTPGEDLGAGDARPKHGGTDGSSVTRCHHTAFELPHRTSDISSTDSSAHLSISSATSSPRSEDGYNVPSRLTKPTPQNESVIQHIRDDNEVKPHSALGALPLQDRNVVGQEKSPVSGILSLALASALSSSVQSTSGEWAPKERKRWARPPLVGQAASSNEVKLTLKEESESSKEQEPSLDDHAKINDPDVIEISSGIGESSATKNEKSRNSSSNESGNTLSLSKSLETGESADENMAQTPHQTTTDGEQGLLSDSYIGGKISPSSSITSHKRLEWDSGADVGYQDYQPAKEGSRVSILKLSAIERLALIQNTDKALRMRLDPEGTSNSLPSTRNFPTPTFNTFPFSLHQAIGQPSAESTPLERASSLLSRVKSSNIIGISPIAITDSSKPGPVEDQKTVEEVLEDIEEEEKFSPVESRSVSRQKSTSLLNLQSSKYSSKFLYLYRSQSDPDLSTDAEALINESLTLKAGKSLSPDRSLKGKGLATRSLSSDSEKTLVQVPAKIDSRDDGSVNNFTDNTYKHETKEHFSGRPIGSNQFQSTQGMQSTSKGYSCSDTDHRHGLHHHYGVICSSCLIHPTESAPILSLSRGIQSSSSTITSSPVSTPRSNNSETGENYRHSECKNLSSDGLVVEEVPIQQGAASTSPPVDVSKEGTSGCVGKATSFEYLPGRLYESEMAGLKSNASRQPEQFFSRPLSSDSTSADSRQNSVKMHVTRQAKPQAVMSSSGDSEDALWSSPRVVSGTLVRDLERGVGALRGLVHNQAYSSAAQRDLVRRVVRRLVSSEYTDDLLERRIRRQNRKPLPGGHTFSAQPPTVPSDRMQTDKRVTSTSQRSSKRAQVTSTPKEPAKPTQHTETGTQPSDSVSSAANESSSLRSSFENEPQTIKTKDSASSRESAPKPTDKQPIAQPAPSPPQPPPSPPAPQSEQPSSQPNSLPKPVASQPATAPVTADAPTASLTAEKAPAPALPYVTLAPMVSFTPMTITVQAAPAAVPLAEASSTGRSVSVVTTAPRAATANAATMTMTPPGPLASSAEAVPATSSTTLGATTDADFNEARRPDGLDARRRKKTVRSGATHPSQQLEWIKCEISHLRTLQQLLKKHPQHLTTSMERPAPSNFSSSRKMKVVECPTLEEPSEPARRSRHHAHPHVQETRAEERQPISILRKPAPPPSSADSRNSESILSSSTTSVSTSASEYCACVVAPAPRPTTEERPPRPQKRAEPAQPAPRPREPSPESEDSVTRAVTQAVSSRVKALRNLGQIEEAEVKIRVRMGQPTDSDGPAVQEMPPPRQSEPPPAPKVTISQSRPRIYKTIDDAQDDDYASKQAELDELIARQRLMDAEARKKLEALTKLRERVLRQTTGEFKEMKPAQPQHRDACTLTCCDTATNTSPQNSVLISRATQIKTTSEESASSQAAVSSSPRSSVCPACRVRAANRASARKVVSESEPMCRHDPGFTAGLPRGRERPPTAYFLKVEEEEVAARPRIPPRKVSSLQVVTVKVPRPVRPPSSLGSSSASTASSGSSSARSESPERFPREMAPRRAPPSSAPAGRRQVAGTRSAPESNRRQESRKPGRSEPGACRSEPRLGQGDGDTTAATSSSDEQIAPGATLQDCLTSNFPEYVRAAETRRQCICEMSYLRRLRQESRKRLVQLDGDAWCLRQKMARSQRPATAPAPAKPAQRPKVSARSMRLATARKFARMPEIEQKKLELKKKEESRTNRLLKEIYTTKLREKALRGETTLRSSVSVISSF